MRRAFTLLEIVCAVAILALMTTMAVVTSGTISRGWEVSTDYADKVQRTDYALNQVVSALRSMYYPCAGSQSFEYGFSLENNGDGDSPRDSDVVEWSRLASVGGDEKTLASVHRMQIRMLEEGDTSWGARPIETTGLYMRRRPDVAIAPKSNGGEDEYGFGETDIYEPVLVADGIVGFNCRVMKEAQKPDGTAEYAKEDFEDAWDSSNSVPYKVELTFRMESEEGGSHRKETAPVMRVVRIPIHEQSLDGAMPPGTQAAQAAGGGGARGLPRGGGQRRGPGGGQGGGAR